MSTLSHPIFKSSYSNIMQFFFWGKKPSEKRFTLVISLMDKTAPYLDKHIFSKYPRLKVFAAYVFGVGSNITYFFMHTIYGHHLLGGLFFVGLVLSTESLLTFFTDFKLTWGEGGLACLREKAAKVDKSLGWLFIVLGALLQLAVLNMYLVSIPSVRGEIDRLFGEDFVRQQGYNTRVLPVAVVTDSGVNLVRYVVGGIVAGKTADLLGDLAKQREDHDFQLTRQKEEWAAKERQAFIDHEAEIQKILINKLPDGPGGFGSRPWYHGDKRISTPGGLVIEPAKAPTPFQQGRWVPWGVYQDQVNTQRMGQVTDTVARTIESVLKSKSSGGGN
jgi:hypothetical protein